MLTRAVQMIHHKPTRASGYDLESRADKTTRRVAVKQTLDPDADEQRWYSCCGCGEPCINPIGTGPESRDLCLDCYCAAELQADLTEWSL